MPCIPVARREGLASTCFAPPHHDLPAYLCPLGWDGWVPFPSFLPGWTWLLLCLVVRPSPFPSTFTLALGLIYYHPPLLPCACDLLVRPYMFSPLPMPLCVCLTSPPPTHPYATLHSSLVGRGFLLPHLPPCAFLPAPHYHPYLTPETCSIPSLCVLDYPHHVFPGGWDMPACRLPPPPAPPACPACLPPSCVLLPACCVDPPQPCPATPRRAFPIPSYLVFAMPHICALCQPPSFFLPSCLCLLPPYLYVVLWTWRMLLPCYYHG